jgi:hypothetical protein
MATQFTIDSRDLQRFTKILKDAPKKIPVATAGVLNTLAFKTREFDIQNLRRELVIRGNQITPEKIIWVDKANYRKPVNSQVSIAASKKKPRFSGWLEQQTGQAPQQRRAFTPAARRGNFKQAAQGRARLKPNLKFGRPEDMDIKNVKSEAQRIGVFLKIMKNRKLKSGIKKAGKQFIIPRYKGFGYGLYNFRGDRFEKYQSFEDSDINKAPKRILWRTASLNSLRLLDMRKIWGDQIKRVLPNKLV